MNVFRNNQGFTISELIVSSGIAVLLSSIATFAFSMAIDVFVRTARLSEAETEIVSALYGLKSAYSQSVNVDYGGDVSNFNDRSTTRGAAPARNVTRGRIFTTAAMNDANVTNCNVEQTRLLSLSLREGNVNGLNSNFTATSVYFQRPCNSIVANFSESGALYIDTERAAANPLGAWVRTTPMNAPFMFTRLTEMHVENVQVLQPDGTIATNILGLPVLSAELRLVMRYFTKGRAIDFRWCPRRFMPGGASPSGACANNVKPTLYSDLEKKLKIVFANNSYDRSRYMSGRPHGNLYFFKNWAPVQGKGQ